MQQIERRGEEDDQARSVRDKGERRGGRWGREEERVCVYTNEIVL